MADDIASLGFAVDSSQAVTADAALKRLNATSAAMEAAAKSLEAAVGALGSAHRRAADETRRAASENAALEKAVAAIRNQLIALAGGLGLVGSLMAAAGTPYLILAAAIKVVVDAIKFLEEESLRMGTSALGIRQFADVAGLAITEVKALKQSGYELGVTGDQTTMAFERLAANLTETRRATGPLFDDIQRINGALAFELTTTRTTAEGINVLARAYAQAGDAAQKATIARAVFGRSGVALGPIFDIIAAAGGIENLTKQTKSLDGATEDQTRAWAKMSAEIAQLENRAKNILASIYTQQGLEAALLAAQLTERFAVALKKAADADTQRTAFQRVTRVAQQGELGAGFDPESVRQMERADEKLAEQARILRDDKEAMRAYINEMALAGPGFTKIATAAEVATVALKQQQDAATTASKTQKDLVAFLGSGASIQDQYIARQREITALYLENKTGADKAKQGEADLLKIRADAANALDRETKLTSGLLGVLGSSASISLQLEAVEQRIRKARQDGIAVTEAQEAVIKRVAAATALGTMAMMAQADASRIEAAAIGLPLAALTSFTLVQTRLAQARREGQPLTAAQIAALQKEATAAGAAAAALERIRIVSEAKFERQTIFLSPEDVAIAQRLRTLYGDDVPRALASTEASALRANAALKQINDAVGTFASGLVTDLSHGVDAVTALQNALRRLSDLLIDMITRRLVAQALGGLLGGSGGATAGSAILGGLVPVAHSGGRVGFDQFPMRVVNPQMFINAPSFARGGEVPVMAHAGEEIGWPAQLAAKYGGDRTININSNYHIAGAVDKAELAGAIKRSHDQAVQKAVVISSGGVPERMARFNRLAT